jgi:hypothetical protein
LRFGVNNLRFNPETEPTFWFFEITD